MRIDSRLRDGAPNLRAAWVCCVVVWLSSAVGVVLAIVERELLVATYAGIAAIAAAGWMVSTRRWLVWQDIADRALATIQLMRGEESS